MIKCNAYSIVLYDNKPWIITQFNHDANCAELALWEHPIDEFYIRKFMPLKSQIKIPIEELDKLKILLFW